MNCVRQHGIDLNKLECILGRAACNTHRLNAHMSALKNRFLNDPSHPDSDILPHLMSYERANVNWTQEEHDKMLEAALKYGKDYSKISELVGTKTRSQCQAYKYRFVKILAEDTENDW